MASSATILVDKMASGVNPHGGSTNSVSSDVMVVKRRKDKAGVIEERSDPSRIPVVTMIPVAPVTPLVDKMASVSPDIDGGSTKDFVSSATMVRETYDSPITPMYLSSVKNPLETAGSSIITRHVKEVAIAAIDKIYSEGSKVAQSYRNTRVSKKDETIKALPTPAMRLETESEMWAILGPKPRPKLKCLGLRRWRK
jgi:hypothetical protein